MVVEIREPDGKGQGSAADDRAGRVPDGSGHEGALRPFDPDRDLLVITTDPSAPASVRAGLAIQYGVRKLREITGMILINRTREGATPLPVGRRAIDA
jgi:hypothetical protein